MRALISHGLYGLKRHSSDDLASWRCSGQTSARVMASAVAVAAILMPVGTSAAPGVGNARDEAKVTQGRAKEGRSKPRAQPVSPRRGSAAKPRASAEVRVRRSAVVKRSEASRAGGARIGQPKSQPQRQASGQSPASKVVPHVASPVSRGVPLAAVSKKAEWAPAAADLTLQPPASHRAALLADYYKACRIEDELGPHAALAACRELMLRYPGTEEITEKLWELCARTGRIEEALVLLEAAVVARPDDFSPLLALSRFYQSRADETGQSRLKGLVLARQAGVRFPFTLPVVAHLVRQLLAAGHREEAQEVVRRALSGKATDADYWLTLAQVARDAFPLDDPATREAHLRLLMGAMDRALHCAPRSPLVVERQADFYARLQMPERAVLHYEKVVAWRPGNLPARQKLGQCYRLLGQTDKARGTFSALLQIDGTDTVAHRAMAGLYEGMQDSKAALPHRMELLRLLGATPKEYTALTQRLCDHDMLAEASLLSERGLFHHPEELSLIISHAHVQLRLQQYALGRKSCERAASLASGGSPQLRGSGFYLLWGRHCAGCADTTAAALHYRKAIELASKAAPEEGLAPVLALAELWLETKQNPNEVGELIRMATSLAADKDAPALCATTGRWHISRREWAEAIYQLERAESRSLSAPTAQLLADLATALLRTGRKAEAMSRVEKALSLPAGKAPAILRLMDECRISP